MGTEKTHWKKAFKSDYLSSSDVDNKDLILTINHVAYTQCMTQSGKKFCNVAYFDEDQKPMILNVVNSKIIKKFSGNKTHLEDWLNIKIQVYVDHNVRFGNETVEGLRIRATQPVKKKLIPLPNDKIVNVAKFIIDGKTIEEVKKTYSITPTQQKEIDSKVEEAMRNE